MPLPWQALLLETQLLARAVDGLLSPPRVQENATARFLRGLAVALSFLAAIALAAGAFLWLRESYTLRETMIMMGAAGLVLALVAGGVAWIVANYRSLHAKVRNRVIREKIKDLGEAVADEFGDTVRAYPKTTAALAALAGLAAGSQAARADSLLRDIDLKSLH